MLGEKIIVEDDELILFYEKDEEKLYHVDKDVTECDSYKPTS